MSGSTNMELAVDGDEGRNKRARTGGRLNTFHGFHDETSIRIVGVACRIAGISGPESFWDALVNRKLCVSDPHNRGWLVNNDATDHTPAPPRAAYMDTLDVFDYSFFGLSGLEAENMDPQQRVALEVSHEAFQDALITPELREGVSKHVGVFAGVMCHNQMVAPCSNNPSSSAAHNPLGLASNLSNRIAHLWDLRGPSITVDTACSSGLTALHLASQSLIINECSYALVVGTHAIMSPDFFTRSSDPAVGGSGSVHLGEGCVALLLQQKGANRNLSNAYARIRSTGISGTGRMLSSSDTSPPLLLEDVMRSGDVLPSEIRHVEADRIGSPAFGPLEAATISSAVCGVGEERSHALPVGSITGNFGQLMGVEALAGLLKAVLCIHRNELVPTAGLERMNHKIDWDALKLRMVTDVEPLVSPWGHDCGEAIIAVNSHGGPGGSNGCAIVQGVTCASKTSRPIADLVDRAPLTVLASHFELALKSTSAPIVEGGIPVEPRQPFRRVSVGPWSQQATVPPTSLKPRLLFVFGGQGTDYAHMGTQLSRTYSVFKQAATEFADAVGDDDFKAFFCQPGATCTPTVNNPEHVLQRHILLSNIGYQVAMVALLKSFGVRPDAVSGHSNGEIAASVVSGRLDQQAFIRVAKATATLQEDLNVNGAMAAWSSDTIDTIQSSQIEVACDNAPGQLTLCGPREAIEKAVQQGKSAKVPCTVLKVRRAFHSADVDECIPQFETDIKAGGALYSASGTSLPSYSSVVGHKLEGPEDLNLSYWRTANRGQCKFREACHAAAADGPWVLLEVSGRPVLGGYMAKNFDAQYPILSTGAKDVPEENGFLQCLGQLYLIGVDVQWKACGWNVYQPMQWNHDKRFPWNYGHLVANSPSAAQQYDSPSVPKGKMKSDPEVAASPQVAQAYSIVEQEVRTAMEWPASHAVERNISLVRMGLDSLLQSSLRSAIEDQCGIALQQSDLDMYPTVNTLSHYVADVMSQTSSTTTARPIGVKSEQHKKKITLDMVEVKPFDQVVAIEHAQFVIKNQKHLSITFKWAKENYSEKDSLDYAENVAKMRELGQGDAFAIYVEGRLSGMVSYQRQPMMRRTTLYLGYWLDSDGLSKIYSGGQAAVFGLQKMFKCVFEEHPDIWRVEAFIQDWNVLSTTICTSVGMWIDCVMPFGVGPLPGKDTIPDWHVLAANRDCWNEETLLFEKNF